MRLIDADELLEHKFVNASERIGVSGAYMCGWNRGLDAVAKAVQRRAVRR